MNYCYRNDSDMTNGAGLRVTLFISGCEHHCEDCFNEQTWDRNYGSPFTDDVKQSVINKVKESHIDGISILGGDPLMPYNYNEVLELCKAIKKETGKSVYIWTGYSYEYVLNEFCELLDYADMIVTERFDKKLKDVTLYLRGSSNQKFIVNKKVYSEPPKGY